MKEIEEETNTLPGYKTLTISFPEVISNKKGHIDILLQHLKHKLEEMIIEGGADE